MRKNYLLAFLILIGSSISAQKKYSMLNHIAIDVTDLSKSYHFYKDIIQLDSMPEPFHDHRHIWFKVGEHSQLHLIEVKNETAVHYKGTHVCFTVASIEDVVSKLNENKIHYENWVGKSSDFTVRPDGVKQIYFQDPDGYWIEVNNDRF